MRLGDPGAAAVFAGRSGQMAMEPYEVISSVDRIEPEQARTQSRGVATKSPGSPGSFGSFGSSASQV